MTVNVLFFCDVKSTDLKKSKIEKFQTQAANQGFLPWRKKTNMRKTHHKMLHSGKLT